jgi:membrane-bound lytic murein transglycosylase D
MDANPFIEYNTGLENIIKSFLKYRKVIWTVNGYFRILFSNFEEALAKQNVPLEIKYLWL